MKRILQTLLLLFAALTMQAQTVQVVIQGTITDTNSNPVQGHQVHIMSDSSFAPVFFYYNTVLTSQNGFYIDTVTMPSNLQVMFFIHTQDCNSQYLLQTGMSTNSPIVANFVLCASGPPPACQANFFWNPAQLLPNTINFSGQVQPQQPATYTWNFGDGSSGTGQNLQHTYNAPGIYTVVMTAVTANNCTSVSTQIVTVAQAPACQAMFVANPIPGVALSVAFTNQSTGSATQWYWDFGDGSFSSLQNPTHTYNQAGGYTICLTIMDSATNCYSVFCDSLIVGTPPPPCHSYFTKQVSGLSVTFQGHMVNNTSATYSWNFGDNTTGAGQNVSHTYAQPGSYLVTLTTTDSGNCVFTSSQQIFLGNSPNCQAMFSWHPDSSANGIHFQDLSLANPVPSSWYWTFGDGTSSTLQNPGLHTYPGPGMYNVCLTITDSGCTSTFCDSILVLNTLCMGHFNQSPAPGNNLVITFQGQSNMAQGNFTWDFGDLSTGSGQTVTHTYSQPGVYNVCMKVTGQGLVCPPICHPVYVGGNTPMFGAFTGQVFAGNMPAPFARVFLIKFDSLANTLTAVDTTHVDSMGFFFFQNVPFGKYLVKAALTPASPVYNNFMPTYFGNVLYWANANHIHVNQAMMTFVFPINLLAGNNPGGPGFIGGNVAFGANKLLGTGDPVEGVEVMVSTLSGTPVAYTWSDQAGNFSIPSLPFGTYNIYAEVPGLPTTPGIVTLDAQNPGHNGILIEIHTTGITTGLSQLSQAVENIGMLYPNPVSDRVNIEVGITGNTVLSIEIIDQYGRLVRSYDREPGNGVHLLEFDVSDLASGFYMLNVRSDDGASSVQRFVRMR